MKPQKWFAVKQGRSLWGALYVSPGSCPPNLPADAQIVPVMLKEVKPTAKEARAIARNRA